MDLKDFIAETLVQIQEGVQEAINRRSASQGAAGVINPVWGNVNEISPDHRQNVEFDVAVTVTDKTTAGGNAGIKVFSIELGGKAEKGAEQSTVSHIKFSIPLVPPVQIVLPQPN